MLTLFLAVGKVIQQDKFPKDGTPCNMIRSDQRQQGDQRTKIMPGLGVVHPKL